MNDLNMLNDKELAVLIVSYIGRIDKLQNEISLYIRRAKRDKRHEEVIREEYKTIKYELRRYAHSSSLSKNRENYASFSIKKRTFIEYIEKAATKGFTIPCNRKIDLRFHSSVDDARCERIDQWSFERYMDFIKNK